MVIEKLRTRCEVENVDLDMIARTTADEDVVLAVAEGIDQGAAVGDEEARVEVAVAAGDLHRAQKVVHVLVPSSVAVNAKSPSLLLLRLTSQGIQQTASSQKITIDELREVTIVEK